MLPLMISSAALIIFTYFRSKSLFLAFTMAAAFLIIAIEWITKGLTKKSPILKYLLDLSVDAPNTYHQVLLFFQYCQILLCISSLIL